MKLAFPRPSTSEWRSDQYAIKQGKVVAELLKEGKSPEAILDDLYARCYSRKPRAAEKANLLAALVGSESPLEPLEDVFWALLNSKEFIFNH